MNGTHIVNKLNELENRNYNIGSKISQTIHNMHPNDVRFIVFYNFAQLIRSIKIYFILKEEYLKERQWYIEIYLQKWGQSWPVTAGRLGTILSDHTIQNSDFDQVMLIAYTQILFSIIDSRFRLFTTAIDATACNEGTEKFYKIHDWLLKRLNKKGQYENFLKFFALIRNTVHHNGRYMNKRYPKPPPISYKQRTYTFEHKKVVEYEGGAFQLLLFEITPDLISMLEDIISSDVILKGPSIPDPMGR
jgi:hypothetical protein